jgi:hypothetical protein
MAAKGWSDAELIDSILTYKLFEAQIRNGDKPQKTAAYRRLHAQHPSRSVKAFEYRMCNISAVYVMSLGRPYVAGLVPAKNVGRGMQKRIVALILKVEKQQEDQLAA